MRAIAYTEFGGPDVLHLTELEPPPLGRDFVRVRVTASSVNPVDWKIRQGNLQPVMEHWFPIVPGWDVSGVVDEVGPAVTEFAPGDHVFGYCRTDVARHGTAAELVAVPVRCLAPAPAPEKVSLSHAAALPLAGLTAWQSLHTALGIGSTDTVVINAAAGGVGGLAIQIAVNAGARVLALTSSSNFDLVADLGASPIDRHRPLAQQVTDLSPTAALDCVGQDALSELTTVVPGHRIASIADATVNDLGGRYVFTRPNPTDLTALAALAEAGSLDPRISAEFDLADTAAAHRLSEERGTPGKILIHVS